MKGAFLFLLLTKVFSVSMMNAYLLLLEVIVEHHGLSPFGTESIKETLRSAHFFPLTAPSGLDVQNAQRLYGSREAITLNQIP